MEEILVRLKFHKETFENKKMFMTLLERECKKYGLDVDEPYQYKAEYDRDDFVTNRVTVIVTQSKNKV